MTCIGHDTACDWWSLGVIAYELMHGFTPFHGDDPFHTFALVLNSELTFPTFKGGRKLTSISEECKDFISKLLVKQRKSRLGGNKIMEVSP